MKKIITIAMGALMLLLSIYHYYLFFKTGIVDKMVIGVSLLIAFVWYLAFNFKTPQ